MSIFQSQAWQQAWWKQWGAFPGFSLAQPGTEGASGFYIDSYKLGSALNIRCLQFVGTNYRRLSTPRSEYNRVSSAEHPVSVATTLRNLELLDWTEAIFRDVLLADEATAALYDWARVKGWRIRQIHRDRAYSVRTTGAFQEYLAGLGSATRLKLFNRRKVLAELGDTKRENYWPGRVAQFFDLLNGFHYERWGAHCFGPNSVDFHQEFLALAELEGARPELSVLSINGSPISVVYNVEFKGCVYNIQSGFRENLHRKIALGTLHLGYCIQAAFEATEIETFDLLAGSGKKTNYKTHLATDYVDLVSLMIVRSRWHRAVYDVKDRLTSIRS